MSIKEIPGFNLAVANSGQFQFAKLDVEDESPALYDVKGKGLIDLHGESTARINALMQEMLLNDLHQDAAEKLPDVQSTYDRARGELRRSENLVEKHGTKLDAFQRTVHSQSLDSSRFLRTVKYEEKKSAAEPAKLRFPSQRALASCLKKNDFFRASPYFNEKKVAEVVSNRLANKELSPDELRKELIECTLFTMPKLRPQTQRTTVLILESASKDCEETWIDKAMDAVMEVVNTFEKAITKDPSAASELNHD